MVVLKKYGELHARLKFNPNLPDLLKEQHVKYLTDSIIYLANMYEVSMFLLSCNVTYWI